MRNLKFQRQLEELEDRKKKAARRSGAKGWNARKELRKIEEEVAAASAEFVNTILHSYQKLTMIDLRTRQVSPRSS